MGNINFDQPSAGTVSSDAEALSVTNTGSGAGVRGTRSESHGLLAGKDPLFHGAVGVYGESLQNGVFGRTASSRPADHAVYGQNDGAGHGVTGVNTQNGSTGFLAGREPKSGLAVGVLGRSDFEGVIGIGGTSGVSGGGIGTGTGVSGDSERGTGVQGFSHSSGGMGFLAGTDTTFQQHAGVYGESDQQGVMGLTTSAVGTGVFGGTTIRRSGGGIGGSCIGVRGETFNSPGVGVQGQSFGTGLAGKFIGNVEVTGAITHNGDFTCTGNAEVTGNLHMSSPTSDIVLGDVAEGFGTQHCEIIEPGTVVVLDQDGLVRPGNEAYDKKVRASSRGPVTIDLR